MNFTNADEARGAESCFRPEEIQVPQTTREQPQAPNLPSAFSPNELFDDVWRTVNAALKQAITAHGDITKYNYGSAGKRIAALLAASYKMKPLYKHEHDGVWFSRNGHRAYLLGEKPKQMWPPDAILEPTVAHHVEIRSGGFSVRRKLVMFYRLKSAT